MKLKKLTTIEEIRAFTDPYRTEILATFNRMGEPATVKQIADKMGEVPAKVHYHVKKLEKVGILELVRTEEINGIVAKFYSPVADAFQIKAKNVNQASLNTFKTEVEKTIHNTYEISKEVVIKEIRKARVEDLDNEEHEDEDDDKDIDAMLGIFSLNLSEEESLELKEFINKCSEKSKANRKDTSKQKYHFFYSIMQIREDK